MKKWGLLPAVLLLAACENGFTMPDLRGAFAGGASTAVEPTVQLTDKERFVAAIATNGCEISPLNVGTVLAQASVSADRSAELLTELVDEGTLIEGAPGSDSLLLEPGSCPTTAPAL